ncbi:HutD/Ves family protein [Fuscibacter oryzae]|uniref:HutD family protein n=1 Tax=Fuscibacter oryzae TaxID=2803939 RepID=A0A8J7MQZ8_9RHOB|nr:HutD family protein [Fuscibacter oryzae]MBL4929625.1 HutD family protein [Fuscibacter oryzae]
MIRHLTAADFRPMPWANGKGVTIELARAEGPTGLLWRLSRASVIENGPFSIFPGIERNLTILTGPGFDLTGEGIALQARPFAPVAFPGDVPVTATGVTAPSDDFNVMTARNLPRPQVQVITTAQTLTPPANTLLAVYAARANSLTLTDEPLPVAPQEPLLAVLLHLPNG